MWQLFLLVSTFQLVSGVALALSCASLTHDAAESPRKQGEFPIIAFIMLVKMLHTLPTSWQSWCLGQHPCGTCCFISLSEPPLGTLTNALPVDDSAMLTGGFGDVQAALNLSKAQQDKMLQAHARLRQQYAFAAVEKARVVEALERGEASSSGPAFSGESLDRPQYSDGANSSTSQDSGRTQYGGFQVCTCLCHGMEW